MGVMPSSGLIVGFVIWMFFAVLLKIDNYVLGAFERD